MKTFVRMVIGECLSEAQAAEFRKIYETLDFRAEPGFVQSSLLAETDGYMVVHLSEWQTVEAMLRFHASRSYRTFVGKTQHLLAGHFVVKAFVKEPNVLGEEVKSGLVLEMAVGLMEQIAGREGWAAWCEKHSVESVGLYASVIRLARLLVDIEMEFKATDRLYEVTEAIAELFLSEGGHIPEGKLRAKALIAMCEPIESEASHAR